ncbi:autotransporter outer membrane beta-barrel domain-containing protein [Helicobacter pametensis]|uniref:autotransporter outer membrane beta-barrel domain-containing protein n=1 Tax=Helicobacter pametensis TaxID=95149 RepID=UPI000482BC38|nr:autotransporter outer membrane beta-barrel domain-containing protein [Helicobacter pametensis]
MKKHLLIPIIASSLVACLANAEDGASGVITSNTTLKENINPIEVLGGKAGLVIRQTDTSIFVPITISLPDFEKASRGVFVGAVEASSGMNAYGIHATGNTAFTGNGGALTFSSITTESGKAIGIQADTLSFNHKTKVFFEKIESASGSAIGISEGAGEERNARLTLTLSDDSQVYFKSIKATNGNAYGIHVNGSANITLSSGALSFDLIAATGSNGRAYGIYTTNGIKLNVSLSSYPNHLNPRFAFVSITANGSDASTVGVSFAGMSEFSGSLIFDQISARKMSKGLEIRDGVTTLKEGSSIAFASIATTGLSLDGSYVIDARDAKSVVFEKNAGLLYGVITEDAKAHSYGIYANMDGTLHFMFGAGDRSNINGANVVSGATGTEFKEVSATGTKNAYGFYIPGSDGSDFYEFKVNGKAKFSKIQADLGNAYGIYASDEFKLSGVGNSVKEITFESIVSSQGDAVGIGIDRGENDVLQISGVKLKFTSIGQPGANTSRAYAIKNDGILVLHEAGLLSFGTVNYDNTTLGKSGIYSAHNGLTYAFGDTIIQGNYSDNNLQPITLDYGFYNTANQVTLTGSFEVNNFATTASAQAPAQKFVVIKDGSSSTLNIDNFTISAHGNVNGANLIGFEGTGSGSTLNLSNTLTINLMKDADKYQALSSTRSEGVAFGDNISLSLSGENAKVIFNSDGGVLEKLSHTAGAKGGVIMLSGEGSDGSSQEYTNRIWTASQGDASVSSPGVRQSQTTRNFNARHLKVNDIQTQGATFVLYADKNAKVANSSTRGIYGQAYTGQPAAASSNTANTNNANTNRTALGGSDSIHVNRTSAGSQTPVDNTLRIALGGLNAQNEQEAQYVILATVDKSAKDKVSFNGLKKSGDSTITETYVGFDVADLVIKRHDLTAEEQTQTDAQTNGFSNIGSIYYSNLVPDAISINQEYLDPIFNSLNVNFFTLSANLNSLSKRLGDLKNDSNSHGVWARVFGGEQSANFGITTHQNYVTTQVGYDYGFDLGESKNYLGVALSYNYASSKQDKATYRQVSGHLETYQNSAITHGIEVALYDTYKADSGLYSDSIVKLAYLTSDVDFCKNHNISSHSNIAVALSEEVGYEFALGGDKEWMITPQATLAYAYMNGNEFKQSQTGGSLSATSDALHLLRMRAGANWGYRFNNTSDSTKTKALLYVGTYYEYDMISGGDMKFTSSNHHQVMEHNAFSSNGRFVLNLGTDVQIQESTKLYVDLEKSFGNSMQKEYQVNFGVRYAFGEDKPQATLEDTQDQKAPVKLKEEKEGEASESESSTEEDLSAEQQEVQ